MRFDIITLFPELFEPLLTSGITRRAYEGGLVDVRLWNPRDHAEGNYRRVDDRSFGGGPGMVMLAEPLFKTLSAIRADRHEAQPAPLVLFSPIGQALNHGAVASWSQSAGAVLLCGRYEGVDQRFIDQYVDQQISLGDFVLSGGDIAAMALLDAVARFHLGNGARVERLNWAADPSAKGLKQSYGLMVNYLYDLKRLDKNRMALAQGRIAIAPAIKDLLP